MPHRHWAPRRYSPEGHMLDEAVPGAPSLDDPLYAQRNPFQTFLLGLAIGASYPLLNGNAGSKVLEAELDDQAVVLWGIALSVGSFLGLAGMLWPRSPARKAWNGLVIERVGLFLVGGAGAVYAFVVWTSVAEHNDVVYTVAVQTAFALACEWRVWQISKRMRWWKAVARWIEGMPPPKTFGERVRSFRVRP